MKKFFRKLLSGILLLAILGSNSAFATDIITDDHLWYGISDGNIYTEGTSTELGSNVLRLAKIWAAALDLSGGLSLGGDLDMGGFDVDNAGNVNITVADTANQVGLSVTQNDVTNNLQNTTLINAGTGTTLSVDHNGVSGNAIVVDSESTATDAISVLGKYGIKIDQDISDGYGLWVMRNIAEVGSVPLANFVEANAASTQPLFSLSNAGSALDITKELGILKLGGHGSTNNEDLSFDFETTANSIGVSSSTGVSDMDFGSIGLTNTVAKIDTTNELFALTKTGAFTTTYDISGATTSASDLLVTLTNDGVVRYSSFSFSNTAPDAPLYGFFKARGTQALPLAAQENDRISSLISYVHDGTDYNPGTAILSDVDGPVAGDSTPSRLEMYTTTTSGFVEALRIDSSQNIIIGSGEGSAISTTGSTLRAPDIIGGTTTDADGAPLAFAPGLGTGDGTPGGYEYYLPVTIGSGTALQPRLVALKTRSLLIPSYKSLDDSPGIDVYNRLMDAGTVVSGTNGLDGSDWIIEAGSASDAKAGSGGDGALGGDIVLITGRIGEPDGAGAEGDIGLVVVRNAAGTPGVHELILAHDGVDGGGMFTGPGGGPLLFGAEDIDQLKLLAGGAGIEVGDALILQDAFSSTITTVSSSTHTVSATDYWISVEYTSTGTVAIDIPDTLPVGTELVFSDSDANATANSITISRSGAETFTTNATAQTTAIISGDGDVIRMKKISSTTWKVY